MGSIPEPPTGEHPRQPDPSVALDLCQRLRELLEAHYRAGAAGYSAQRDLMYRRARNELLDILRRMPVFRRLKNETYVFPPTLADKCDEISKLHWDFGEREGLVRFQGQVLTALEAAGVPHATAPMSPESAAAVPAVECAAGKPTPNVTADRKEEPRAGDQVGPNRGTRPTWATARRASRMQRGRTMRARGDTVGEIARKLDVSERTVYNYLNDPSDLP